VGIFGDKTVEFLRDPIAFVEHNCEKYNSKVFLTRIALKQTFVIADYNLLTDFLNNHMGDFYNGLKDTHSDLFGHNIMFADPLEAEQLRSVLLPLFGHGICSNHRSSLQDLLVAWKSTLDCNKPVNFYEHFKNISLAYNLEIFMGVKKMEDEAFFAEVSELATNHWHGVMSFPMSVSVPLLGSGGYKKAMEAKKKLINIIKRKLQESGSEFFVEFKKTNNNVMDEELLFNHMLLFSCALIPKGVASVLSMFFETGPLWRHLIDSSGNLSEDNLEMILLEVMRMFPPFLGGLRVALRDCTLGPYHLPTGTTVFYSLQAAMRDPGVFLHAEQFMPGRWRNPEDRSKNLGFSTGPHDCIGRHFTLAALKHIASFTLEHFRLTWPKTCTQDVKPLPVLRPRHPYPFLLTKKA